MQKSNFFVRKKHNIIALAVFVTVFVLLIFSLAAANASAINTPHYLTYEGRLTNSSGTAQTGDYSMVFSIYSVSTGGTALWTETHPTVSVDNGYFSVQLGSITALDLAFDVQYWVGVNVEADGEMTPRTAINSVGYAYATDVAYGTYVTSTAPTASAGKLYYDSGEGNLYAYDAVASAWMDLTLFTKDNSDNIYYTGGNVGVATTTPGYLLTVNSSNNTDKLFQVATTTNQGIFTIDETGDVGIGTISPAYTLDVNGNIRATTALTVGINVETLAGDKTLTPGTDKMYQYLDPNGANKTITLDTTSASAGDRFIIRHNGAYDSGYYLLIQQTGSVQLDLIHAGGIKEFVFDGTNWISGENGGGENDNKKFNVSIGYNANASNSGIAVGYGTIGNSSGIAVGYQTQGSTYGTAVGSNAQGNTYGIAVGSNALGSTYGIAVGSGAKGMRYGVAVGYQAGHSIDISADRYNNLFGAYSGYQITTGTGNLILGYQSGYDATYSPTTGSKNILIGYQAGTPANDTSNFLNIGNILFGTGVNTATGVSLSTGNLGVATTTPDYVLSINSADASDKLFQVATTTNQGIFTIDETGDVGIGTTSPNQKLTIEGTMSLKEQADANADTAGYGQIWVNTATPNELYFTDDAGTDHQLGVGGSQTPWTSNINAAGYTLYGNSTASGNLTLDSTSNATKGYVLLNSTGGNVGVATTTPGYLLTVNSSNNTDKLFQVATTTNQGIFTIDEAGDVGIGTTSPEFKLSLGGDGGIIAKGTYGSGTALSTSGAGTRLIWYPKKAAFRAGYVSGTQWNDGNINNYSIAMGYNTIASGNSSTAMGLNTTASNDYSTAMGYYTTASGGYSTAMGNNTTASGSISTAMGYHTTASGNSSTAMGYYATADSYASVAIGRYNVGGGTVSSWVATDPLFEIGIGADGSNKANALTVLKNGNVGVATTTPGYLLTVNSSNSTDKLFQVATTTNQGIFTIDEAGDVGIGTTSPNQKLTIEGTMSLKEQADANADTAGYGQIWVNTATPNELYFTDDAGTDHQLGVGGSQTPWTSNINAAGYTLYGNSTASGNLTLDSTSNATKGYVLLNPTSGNVGIGTTSPDNKLTINTPDRVDGESNSIGQLVVAGPTASPPSNDFTNSNAVFRINGTDATNSLQFGVGASGYGYRPWIQGSYDNGGGTYGAKAISLQPLGGNVSIGSAVDVGSRLSVNGGISAGAYYDTVAPSNGMIISGNVGVATTTPGYLLTVNSSNNTDKLFQVATTTNQGIFTIDEAGDVAIGNLITNGAVYVNNNILTTVNPSSRQYKDNIQPIDLDPTRLLDLQPKSFTWINNGKDDFGYIAEDVKEVLPELYQEGSNTVGWRISQLPFYIIELLKLQQQQIDNLTVTVATGGDISGVSKADSYAGTIVVTDGTIRKKVTFNADVEIDGKLYLTQDQAGVLTVPAGDSFVEVKFDGSYEVSPLITVTPKQKMNLRDYWVSDESQTGFTLNVDPIDDEVTKFNWFAVPVMIKKVKPVETIQPSSASEAPTVTEDNAVGEELGVVDVEATTAEVTPAEVTTDEVTPAEVTTDEVTTAEVTPAEATTDEATTAEVTTDEVTPAEATTAEATTDEVTTDEVTTAEVTPAEATTDEVAPAEVTTDEVTPAEVTPAEVTTD